ncbi:MAG: PAS domain S-box protein [Rhodospirillales bacterium]|nr:PAS domain S-box protein [Rhodospirillales bacterium]
MSSTPVEDTASLNQLLDGPSSVLGVLNALAWSYDLKSSRFLDIDFAGETFLGYTRAEWGSLQLWPSHIHPDDRSHVVSRRMAAHTNGKGLDVEYRIRCKDESYVWVRELSGLASQNETGFITKGILCDVTESHGTRGLAPEREYQYRKLLDSMPDAFLIEQDNTIVFANPAAERMLEVESGYSLIGREADKIFVDLHHAQARYDALTRGGRKVCTSNESVQALSGHLFDAEIVSCLTVWRDRKAIQTVVRDLSWLNKVLELLRDERNLMKLILDHIGDGVCLVDADGMIKSTNPPLSEMFGITEPAFFGRTAHELFHAIGDEVGTSPDTCPICAKQKAGEFFQFEKTFARDADGASVILRFENTPIFNADQPYGSVVTVRDLTEELKSQAEIDKLTLAIEQNPIAIQITDLDGKIEYANSNLCSVTGRTAEDLHGRISPFFDGAVVGSDVAGDVMRQLKSTQTWNGEFQDFEGAGRRYWIRGVVTPMKDKNGKVNYLVGMYRDMTDEKYAEALQKATEGKVSVIFESLGNAILIVSENGRIQNSNPAATQLFDYDNQALEALEIGDIVPGISVEDYSAASLRRQLRAGRETVAVTRSGRQIPVILTVAEMPEPEWAYTDRRTKRRRSFICTLQDISEQKNAQSAVENAHKMEALGQLTGGLAHDFNNLLGIVIGNLDLAKEESENQPDLQSFVTTAQRAALRGAELTRSLLDFSRSSTVNTENLDVNEVVSELEQLMLPALTARITVNKSLESDLWHVNLNRSEFLSALMNLALNARDAMPGGGTVTVSTRNVNNPAPTPVAVGICPPGHYVAIELADTGEGMDENTLGKMFEPFYTTKEKGKGTGLGLSTVFGFVHRANGVIDVQSKPGEGTVITLLVPRASKGGKAIDPETSAQGPGNHTEGELLVVDDEPELASFCQSTLERSGYVVHVAANGTDALQVLRDNPKITTMITDIVMPGEFDGIDLCGEVAKVNERIKVILTTGYAEKLDGSAPLPGNCYDLIRKPFRGRQLLEVVDRVTSISI